jgi:hypothetical protein
MLPPPDIYALLDYCFYLISKTSVELRSILKIIFTQIKKVCGIRTSSQCNLSHKGNACQIDFESPCVA